MKSMRMAGGLNHIFHRKKKMKRMKRVNEKSE